MNDALSPVPPTRSTAGSRRLLDEIASVLGVEVEAFLTGPPEHPFYADHTGASWRLLIGSNGAPVVRRDPANDKPNAADVSVSAFLAQHHETPQGQALAKLIDHCLVGHMR